MALTIIVGVGCIFRLLRYHRQNTIIPLIYPNHTPKLSSLLLNTHISLPFFQCGPENYKDFVKNDDVLIFYSIYTTNNYKQNDVYAANGTFLTEPTSCLHLYTVSCVRYYNVFPAMFAVLKNKNF